MNLLIFLGFINLLAIVVSSILINNRLDKIDYNKNVEIEELTLSKEDFSKEDWDFFVYGLRLSVYNEFNKDWITIRHIENIEDFKKRRNKRKLNANNIR